MCPCPCVRGPFYIVLHTDSYNKVGGRGATRAPLRDFIVGAQLPCVMPYDSAWMYHAADTWASSSDGLKFLRGAQPTILSLPTIDLSLPSLPRIAGPPSLGPPASAKLLNTFNPAIARAPRKLCPRCAYVVAMRVDGLHQVSALCRPCGARAVVAHTLRLLRPSCSRPPLHPRMCAWRACACSATAAAH